MYACEYFSSVANRAVLTNPTKTQMEKQMLCDLIPVTNCSKQYQRFWAALVWQQKYPKLKWTGKSMSLYFDRLVMNAVAFKPSLKFGWARLIFVDYFTVKIASYIDWSDREVSLDQVGKFLCFNSSQLRIDCETHQDSDNMSILAWVNFTFVVSSTNASKLYLTFNYNRSLRIKSGSIVKDKNGKNAFQMLATADGCLKLFDFNTNSQIVILSNGLHVNCPIGMLNKSNGLLLENIENEVKKKKIRRNVLTPNVDLSCAKICENFGLGTEDPTLDMSTKLKNNQCIKECRKNITK